MQIDGRKLSHETSEQIRRMAVKRVRESERASDVIRSFGPCRTTIYAKPVCVPIMCWAEPGAQGAPPEVPTSGRRQSINAISAVSASGKFWYEIYTQRLGHQPPSPR